MTGNIAELNQFKATFEAEFRIKIFPIAARAEPTRHRYGFSTSRKVLIQTPIITKKAPKEHPIFIPNLSNIQLAGNAANACAIGKNKVFKVITVGLSLKTSSTMLLMLENACIGSELTSAAKTYTNKTTYL